MSRTSDSAASPSPTKRQTSAPAPQAHMLISTDEVLQRLAAQPAGVQRHEADHLQRTLGNQAVGKLVAHGQIMQGQVAHGQVVQRDPVKVTSDSALHNKERHVIGEARRGSAESRKETEEMLLQSTAEAAAAIHSALTTGLPALKAFERVTFAMAGHDGSELRTEYQRIAGRALRADFDAAFSSAPGPMARDYLDGCLLNNGTPTLRGRVALALGLVDSSSSLTSFTYKVGATVQFKKLGSLGDPERVLELIEAAEPAERKTLYGDAQLVGVIRKSKKKVAERFDALVKVDDTEAAHAAASQGGAPAVNESQKLAEARDEQLAVFVLHAITEMPLATRVKDAAMQAKVLVTGTGYTKGSMGNVKFASKKFADDLLTWKASARPEDVAHVQAANSKFALAMKQVPTNWLTGVDKDERAFVADFIAKLDPTGQALSGGDTQVEAVSGSLERQKQYVNRGPERGWLRTRLPRLVADKKWRTLEAELKMLTAEQRKQILNDYDVDPAVALQTLEEDLKAAGFNREERASIAAMFVTEFGEIGSRYAELKELVQENTRATAKRKAIAVVNPKKWTKASQAFNGKAIGAEAYKIILQLEGNEFVLVRNDRVLLAALKEHSEEKVWQKILDALGMQNIDDQVAADDSRKMVHEARLDAEGNPRHWALILDQAIDDFKVMHNSSGAKVGVGRDKAQLYRIGLQIQNTARLMVRNERAATPEEWLLKVIKQLSEVSHDKLQYLHDSVPEVYFAIRENRPIPLDVRIKRAKYEGFGIRSKRKVDRQKLHWSFQDVQGRQLLDEWSNLYQLRELHAAARLIETDIGTADDATRPQLVQRLAELYLQMQQFMLGIHPERQKEFKALGVSVEDRLKFEQMVVDKIADATEEDTEVQQILDELNLSYDDFMRAKMRGISALEMQRYLDTTRQWHLFSTKGSQLSEATRNVKGAITSTERKLDPKQQASAQGQATAKGAHAPAPQPTAQEREELSDIRGKGGKATEVAMKDRTLLEARFRDMQARLRKYAMAIFKLLTSAIIFAIVTAATWGAGAPLAIGLHVALEFGFAALQAAYQYYVLGDRDLTKIAVDFGMNLLDATVRILTANLGAAMQASFLHPDALLPGADWLARPIAKQLSGLAHEVFMFLPEQFKAQIMHEKPLEEVIEEGEDSIADNAVKQLIVGQAKGFITKIAIAGVKEGQLQGMGAITGEGVTKKETTQKSFGQAYTDRLAGGATQEEQDQMWARYQKQKLKGGKKELIKAVRMKDKLSAEAEKKQRKDEMKHMRKGPKDPAFDAILEVIERNLVTYRGKRGEPLLRQLIDDRIPCLTLLSLNEKQKVELEELLLMNPGQLDTQLAGSPPFQLLANSLRPFHPLIVARQSTLANMLEADTVKAAEITPLTLMEKRHLALYFGISLIGLRTLIGEGGPMPLGRPARLRQQPIGARQPVGAQQPGGGP